MCKQDPASTERPVLAVNRHHNVAIGELINRHVKGLALGLLLSSNAVCLASPAGVQVDRYSEPLSLWLARNPEYRVAADKDCSCEIVIEHNKREVRRDYTPYRVGGDFDGDGSGDVALVVVNVKRLDDFRVLVFASRLRSGKSPLVYKNMLDDQNLAGIGLATKRVKGRDLLLFGTLNADGAEIIYVPDQVP